MYLWRKIAEPRWLGPHENILQACSGGRLAIILKPGRKRRQLEIACTSRDDSRKLVEEFGGRVEKLPHDWLQRFARLHQSKPIKVGKRLVIAGKIDFQTSKAFGLKKPRLLVIPASAAFGTGGHTTTAMSLRLLERLTREWKNSWSLADLGTGSGILALAAERFGAGRVVGLRKWKSRAGRDVVAANLYSRLLIEILPKLRRAHWLILSGVLRMQENKLLHALRRNKIEIVKVNRRGKWIAVLAKTRHASRLRSSPRSD